MAHHQNHHHHSYPHHHPHQNSTFNLAAAFRSPSNFLGYQFGPIGKENGITDDYHHVESVVSHPQSLHNSNNQYRATSSPINLFLGANCENSGSGGGVGNRSETNCDSGDSEENDNDEEEQDDSSIQIEDRAPANNNNNNLIKSATVSLDRDQNNQYHLNNPERGESLQQTTRSNSNNNLDYHLQKTSNNNNNNLSGNCESNRFNQSAENSPIRNYSPEQHFSGPINLNQRRLLSPIDSSRSYFSQKSENGFLSPIRRTSVGSQSPENLSASGRLLEFSGSGGHPSGKEMLEHKLPLSFLGPPLAALHSMTEMKSSMGDNNNNNTPGQTITSPNSGPQQTGPNGGAPNNPHGIDTILSRPPPVTTAGGFTALTGGGFHADYNSKMEFILRC